MTSSLNRIYSSKIIKAGALLADTKTLLAHWSEKSSFAKNIGYVLANRTLLGKNASDLFKAQVEDQRISELIDFINVKIPTDERYGSLDTAGSRGMEIGAQCIYYNNPGRGESSL